MKIRILSVCTLVCLFCSALVFGQGTITDPGGSTSVSKNTIKRISCLSDPAGCSPVAVELRLSSGSVGATKTIDHPDAGEEYPYFYTKIKVKIGSNSSIGTYYLPTTIGETVAIAGDAGLGVYNVYIKKTATREFYLSVSDSNF